MYVCGTSSRNHWGEAGTPPKSIGESPEKNTGLEIEQYPGWPRPKLFPIQRQTLACRAPLKRISMRSLAMIGRSKRGGRAGFKKPSGKTAWPATLVSNPASTKAGFELISPVSSLETAGKSEKPWGNFSCTQRPESVRSGPPRQVHAAEDPKNYAAKMPWSFRGRSKGPENFQAPSVFAASRKSWVRLGSSHPGAKRVHTAEALPKRSATSGKNQIPALPNPLHLLVGRVIRWPSENKHRPANRRMAPGNGANSTRARKIFEAKGSS